MAVEYVHTIPSGTLTVKWVDSGLSFEIHASSAISDLLVQDLLDAIRAAEDSLQGQGYAPIARASGKDPLGTGVATGITLSLLGSWRVYSTKSSGLFRVFGGNLLRDDGADPFRPNNQITYLLIQSAAATIVTTGEGGGGGGSFTSNDRTLLQEVHTGTAPLVAALLAALWARVVDGAVTFGAWTRKVNAVLRGDAAYSQPDPATKRIVYRDEAGAVEETHDHTNSGRGVS